MIAVIMFTVSLLTIEHDKALAKKKIIAVLKIRAMEKGEVIHRVAMDQVRQEKRIPAVINSDSKKFTAHVSLDISL